MPKGKKNKIEEVKEEEIKEEIEEVKEEVDSNHIPVHGEHLFKR